MKKLFIFLVIFLNFFAVLGCFWDQDTLAMETQQFPSVLELLSGKFLRHSPEYHYWRIKDREKKLETDPENLNYYDDLAVSYSKIGDNKTAIRLMLKKDSIQPNEYKTYANLGTVYLHDGNFRKGIYNINRAIKINPDAHFGREVYQKYLAEYIMTKQRGTQVRLPMSEYDLHYRGDIPRPQLSDNFYAFLLNKYKEQKGDTKIQKLPKEEIDKALTGVMGMMKFGTHDSPILLEAMGDLLINSGWYEGARMLAARAYLKAAYSTEQSRAKKLYRDKAKITLHFQQTVENNLGIAVTLEEVEKQFKVELAQGTSYYNQIRSDELTWIHAGKDPEALFEKKYYKEPVADLANNKKVMAQEKSENDVIDYRPESIDSSEIAKIDSLFNKNEVKADTVNNEENNQPIITDNQPTATPFIWSMVGFALILVVGIGFALFIIYKTLKQK